jgi:hypothetical protein
MGIAQSFFVSRIETEQAACNGLWTTLTVKESFLWRYVKEEFYRLRLLQILRILGHILRRGIELYQSSVNDLWYIERVEELKYLATTLINQHFIQAEIKSRLKLGNACYPKI